MPMKKCNDSDIFYEPFNSNEPNLRDTQERYLNPYLVAASRGIVCCYIGTSWLL